MLIHTQRGIILPPDLDRAGWRVECKAQGDAYVYRAVNGDVATRWLRWYGEMEKAVRKMPQPAPAQMTLFEEATDG